VRWCWSVLVVGAAALLSAGWRAAAITAEENRAPGEPHRAAATVDLPQPALAQPARVSPRNANYSIDVELDTSTRTLQGREVLTWRNISSRPATELQFHLYYNAWMNDHSTWLRERAIAPFGRNLPNPRPGDWGWIEVTAIRLLSSPPAPFTDLTAARRYIAPDDGNAEDRTVMSVQLPRPIEPGQTVGVEIAWTSKIPRTFARTGVVGDYYFIAQWFPKVGVLEAGGWNTHQFHASTEFFADYGVYDVRITVPREWIVGATGREQQVLETPTGKTTHRFVQEDVHDFVWTTSPHYLERRARFEHPGLPPVDMRLLLQPEHEGQAARHFAATRAVLQYYGQWYGPYPYGHVTIVDPAWQSAAGGMEYPTLFTAGTHWLAPERSGTPEGVTVHEAGHQFWCGLVGNNEFEHAWLDEGLNTFSTSRVLSRRRDADQFTLRLFGEFIPWLVRDVTLDRADHDGIASYVRDAESDAQATPSWQYYPATGASITYSKTAVWLHTLERLIGWPRLQRGMSLFFTRHVFTHPTPDDFFKAINEGAGEDLTWFFDQVYRGSNVVDYGVQRFTSDAVSTTGWMVRNGNRTFVEKEPAKPARYATELVVRRYGEAVMPVDLLVTFADGYQVRQRWDGRDRWRLYRWERPSRATSAAVDPERVLLVDVNYTNNTWTLEPAGPRAARKWSLTWFVWLQDALLTWAALV
jgi:hypothetical protein